MKVRDALTMAANIAAGRSSIPILAHVRVSGGHCMATDTNQQLELPVELPAELGAFCVHAHRLLRVLKVLPESQDLELRMDSARALHVSAGNTRFKLNTLSADDFPIMAAPDDALTVQAEVDGAQLANALAFIKPAMATNDVRYYLNGAYIEIKDSGLVVVGTDGHRVHRRRIDLDGDLEGSGSGTGIISYASVPRIIDIAQRHGRIELSLYTSRLTVESDEVLQINLINGKYPDIERVIPRAQRITGSISRTQLADTIDAVMQLSIDKKDVRVELTCGAAGIALSATNREGERGESYVPWAIADNADITLEVGFMHHLLTEALRAFTGENVFLHLPADASGALYITDDSDGSREAVIMPLRA